MLNQQTIEKLYTMRMRGMADAFAQQQEDPQSAQLSFEERFALLVDRQWNWRQNRALERRLRDGRLQGPACIEDIDFRAARGLDKQVIRPLIQDSDWVRRHQHIFLIGPTGIGKTFLARAFGQKACRDGFTAYFATAAQLFRELELGRADGSYAKKLRALGPRPRNCPVKVFHRCPHKKFASSTIGKRTAASGSSCIGQFSTLRFWQLERILSGI